MLALLSALSSLFRRIMGAVRCAERGGRCVSVRWYWRRHVTNELCCLVDRRWDGHFAFWAYVAV